MQVTQQTAIPPAVGKITSTSGTVPSVVGVEIPKDQPSKRVNPTQARMDSPVEISAADLNNLKKTVIEQTRSIQGDTIQGHIKQITLVRLLNPLSLERRNAALRVLESKKPDKYTDEAKKLARITLSETKHQAKLSHEMVRAPTDMFNNAEIIAVTLPAVLVLLPALHIGAALIGRPPQDAEFAARKFVQIASRCLNVPVRLALIIAASPVDLLTLDARGSSTYWAMRSLVNPIDPVLEDVLIKN